MSSPTGQPISEEEMPTTVLPNELVTEILTRLPGKEVGRCKCVCRPWRSIIRSRLFMEKYRKRQSGLLFYWWENIPREEEESGFPMRRFHFFHCPLRQPGELPEEFSPLPELKLALEIVRHGRGLSAVSQLVHGLLCVGEGEPLIAENFKLTLRSIFTTEIMRLPDPLPCGFIYSYSTYHLGYDPVSGVFKLLRLIFDKDELLMQKSHIMTLRPPSGSLATWRELDFDAAGICHLHLVSCNAINEIRASHLDGMLCWIETCREEQVCDRLLCFDVSTERFRLINCPEKNMVWRLSALTRFEDRLALWMISHGGADHKVNGVSCYVQEDGEGKNWSKQHPEFLNKLMEDGGYAVVSGDNISFSPRGERIVKEPAEYRLCFSSSGEMLVKNPDDDDESWRVYSCSPQGGAREADALFVGKFPEGAGPKLDRSDIYYSWSNTRRYRLSNGRLNRLEEGNNLYLSLDDVLGNGGGM